MIAEIAIPLGALLLLLLMFFCGNRAGRAILDDADGSTLAWFFVGGLCVAGLIIIGEKSALGSPTAPTLVGLATFLTGLVRRLYTGPS